MMRKEVVFAIIAGGLLGLVLAFGIWRANLAFKKNPNDNGTNTQTSTPTATSDFKISIAKPDNNQVVTSSPLTISGITTPNSYVIASNDEEDAYTIAGGDGTFDLSINLSAGINQTKIFAFETTGKQAQLNLTTVFSSEYDKASTTTSTTATGSADVIQQKVDQKIKEASSTPIAYLGTVTDLTDNTIQIKSVGSGEIQQVSWTQDGTVFVKNTSNATKTIKFSEIAIGDFIVGMGVKNGSDVLKAKRILVTNPVKENSKFAMIGKVSDVPANSTKITVTDFNNKAFSVTPGDDITVIQRSGDKEVSVRFAAIAKNDLIIAVGTLKDTTLTARSVYMVNTSTPSATPKATVAPKQ